MKILRLLLIAVLTLGLLPAQPYQCSTVGEQRLLAVIVNNKTTVGAVQDAFFGPASNSLDTFFRYSSYNQTFFTGDIVNVQIQAPNTCDPLTVKDRADEAMLAQGVNLDLYTRRVYIGGVNPCYWLGSVWAFFCNRSTMGGTQYSTLWLNGLGVWNHEMGHVFGLAHTNGADPTDAMGDLVSPFNAPHRIQLGWLDTVQDVTASGTYLVSALETQTFNPQVLKIQKSSNEWYWVSYRPSLTAGAYIHAWTPNDGEGIHMTRLVDTTPDTPYSSDAALVDGASFTDASAGVTITQVTHVPEFATVSVQFGSAPPPPPPPPDPEPEPEPVPAPAPSIQVEVYPSAASVSRKQSVQFTANQPVHWSVSGAGTISAGGLYTAPTSKIKKTTTVTVTASDPNNSANKATAIVTLRAG